MYDAFLYVVANDGVAKESAYPFLGKVSLHFFSQKIMRSVLYVMFGLTFIWLLQNTYFISILFLATIFFGL